MFGLKLVNAVVPTHILPALLFILDAFAVAAGQKKKKKTSLQIFVRSVEVQEKETVGGTAGSRETLPGGVELTPTHGQVHIPMSTKAAEMCLHATPTVSRAASNDHHMLTSCLLPAQEHMEPTDEQNQGELLQQNYERVQVSWVEGFMK